MQDKEFESVLNSVQPHVTQLFPLTVSLCQSESAVLSELCDL